MEKDLITPIQENLMNNDPNQNKEFSLYGYIKKNAKNSFIATLVLAIIIMYAWTFIKSKNAEAYHTERYNALYEAAYNFTNEKNDYFLKMVSHSFSFAILSEMMRSNYENIEIYTSVLLKSDNNITEIIVSDMDGNIIVATNKKFENTSLRDYFLFNFFTLNKTSIIPDPKNNQVLVVSPIKGINQNQGYLIIRYNPEMFDYQ